MTCRTHVALLKIYSVSSGNIRMVTLNKIIVGELAGNAHPSLSVIFEIHE